METKNNTGKLDWKIEHMEEGRCWITENGEPILKIAYSENEYQIAKRIIKSVNMHNETLDMILAFVRDPKSDTMLVKRAMIYDKGQKTVGNLD